MSSDDIYTIYNIDKSKLKRDYIKYPLLKHPQQLKPGYYFEIPDENDFYYLYIICNVSLKDMLKYFNISYGTFKRWRKQFNIQKNSSLQKINRNISNITKNGYLNLFSTQTFKQYIKKNKKEIIEKMQQTRKRNNSFNKSKPEEEIYKLLCQKYNDVKRQYKSEKYPFACDFYIPSEDLYIEYQGFWMHGFEPYIDTKEQKEKVKLWETKITPQYTSAIKTWTIKDLLKRQTANKNNLNWIEFFNMNQFNEWFNKN